METNLGFSQPTNNTLDLKKKILIIAGIVLIIFLIIIVLILNSINKNSKKNSISEIAINKKSLSSNKDIETNSRKELFSTASSSIIPTKTISKTKNFLPVAEKVLSCLDKMRDERGAYLYSQTCSNPSNCQKLDSNHSGPRPIWAWFKHYQKTKNPKDLETIKKDLEVYLTKIPTIQNDFWNCKLMYDIWSNGNLPFDIKKRLENLCFYGNYVYSENIKVNQLDLKKVIETKKNAPYPTETATTTTEDILRFAFFSSDFVARYRWGKNLDDLQQAKNFFSYAVTLYNNEKKFLFIKSKCVLGIASTDLYKATKDKNYLDFAKDLYDLERVNDLCLKNDQISAGHCRDSLSNRVTCTFFADELYLLTKEEKYKNFKEQSLAETITDHFDYQGYKGNFSNNGCFNSYLDQYSENHKYSLENGLIAGLLLTE